MKYIFLGLMLGLARATLAQDGEPVVPIELRDMAQDDPRAKQYEPVDAPGIEAMTLQAVMAKPPEPCFDWTALPRPLPNGSDQYPTKACTDMDYTESHAEGAAAQTTAPVGQVPAANGTPLQGMPVATQPVQTDMNALQMQRLGELDAMQGRPVNMQNASVLGYMQGYVHGQQMRVQTLPGNGRGGNFGGFGR